MRVEVKDVLYCTFIGCIVFILWILYCISIECIVFILWILYCISIGCIVFILWILYCISIECNLGEPERSHTYSTAVQNPPNIYYI